MLACTLLNVQEFWAQSAGAAGAGSGTATPQATAPAADSGQVVIKVGELQITAREFEQLVASLPPQFRNMVATLGRKGFAEQYGNLLALALEGEKRGLDQSERFQRMLEFDRKMLLAQEAMSQVAAETGPTRAEDVASYYNSHLSDYEQVRVRAIYIPFSIDTPVAGALEPLGKQEGEEKRQLTETQARDRAAELRTRISTGEDMAAVARAESDHPTAAQGGDFGFVSRGQLAPEITAVIFGLQVHELSEPVRDRFGYFLFRAEEKRSQPLAEVQQGIQQNLGVQRLNSNLEKVRAAYQVVLNEEYFSDEPPAPVTPR
jgi:parvulin-like peptidyl-prolyl isomerase